MVLHQVAESEMISWRRSAVLKTVKALLALCSQATIWGAFTQLTYCIVRCALSWCAPSLPLAPAILSLLMLSAFWLLLHLQHLAATAAVACRIILQKIWQSPGGPWATEERRCAGGLCYPRSQSLLCKLFVTRRNSQFRIWFCRTVGIAWRYELDIFLSVMKGNILIIGKLMNLPL